MVWGRTSDGGDHRERSRAFSAGYDQRGRSGAELLRRVAEGRGSRGGAPIWVLHGEGFGLMPSPCTCGGAGDGPARTSSVECPRHGPLRRLTKLMNKGAREGGRWGPTGNPQDGTPQTPAYEGSRGIPQVTDEQAGLGSLARLSRTTAEKNAGVGVEREADPDGYAVFGRFPKGLLRHVLKLQLLGDVRHDEVLHVCSGTLTERWTVDVRAEARPRVQADGKSLPFRDACFKAVLMDPPYSDAYAKNLYGVENPRPSWLLREAARVVMSGGRIGILHVAIPFAPPGCHLVRVWPVSTGVGFRIRALTIYQRDQAGFLFDDTATEDSEEP